ncbi:MAG: rhomboid family intramembrane serine protease [Leeuwenhoekiella sp.]
MTRITDTVKVLIIINVIFYIGSQIIGSSMAIQLFGLWFPQNPNFQIWQPLTHMFMHDQSGIGHILFNMFGLWMFGSPVEQAFGQKKFIFFYFSAGLGAALIHTLVGYIDYQQGYRALVAAGMNPEGIPGLLSQIASTGSANLPEGVSVDTIRDMYSSFAIPAVGASGAVYGILVAFGMLYPNMELMLIFFPIPIKAKIFIPLLILGDLFSGITGSSFLGQNVANWAHIGGALSGFIMVWYWKKNSFNDKRWY